MEHVWLHVLNHVIAARGVLERALYAASNDLASTLPTTTRGLVEAQLYCILK